MPDVFVDFIGAGGEASGELATYMAQNGRMDPGLLRPYMDPKTGRTYVTIYAGGDPTKPTSYKSVQVNLGAGLQLNNSTLRRDEWKRLDDAVIGIAEYRLGGVQDLIANGLVYNIGSGMNSTVLEWHDVSDALEADMTMDGVTRAQGDRPVYTTNYLPLPIIHADYELNARILSVSRNLGNPLDTTLAERAARRVNEKLENMLFSNTTYSFGGGTIYSYLNHPDRNSVAMATAWDELTDDSDGTVGQKILANVQSMKQASINVHRYGPWMVYVPTAYETLLDDDYNTSGTSTQTIRDRLMKISGIKGIKVIDSLADDTVLMVQMTSDVVRLVQGMGIQNVEWQTEVKMITKYKVMTIQVPQIRSDQNGSSGIVVLS